MVSKKKQKDRKRQRQNTKSSDDLEVIEVSAQKKRLVRDEDVIQIGEKFYEIDESTSILPTRECLAIQLVAALKAKALAVVEGPLGSGKTFLVAHAAKSLSLPLEVMQMGDQVDSKTLFGSYHCTEVAGQFIWKPSKFAEWLKKPCVVLLEDVDAANADVISQVIALSRSHRSSSALSASDDDARKEILLHSEVRIVATISGKGKKNPVLGGVPVRIRVEALSDEELRRLSSKAFPRVAHLVKTLISVFRTIESYAVSSNSRHLTSTDFLRGCARLEKLNDLSSNVQILAELVDVWCLADARPRCFQLAHRVANALSISEDQLNFHLAMRQPEIFHDEVHASIGRAKLLRKVALTASARHRFGHTRDVVQLMERIAVGVQMRESVLLVGETGVGKTSVVQAVADLVGARLVVVNLSPTSDSDELIQGYKPTTIGRIMEPLTRDYMRVFGQHFDLAKNAKFIENIERCLAAGRFRDYLTIVETTATKALANKKNNASKDERWAELLVRARRIRDGLDKGASPFALQKGAVLEAAQNGHWLLVDEINLAPPDCLDAIVHAISAPETHPEFRLFACMNPATDAGKRRLPASVRTRFTEVFVSETSDPHQLALIVSAYLPSMSAKAVEDLVDFYLAAKQLHPATYSLRTLCRALLFTADNLFGSEDRSLYEAVCMAFLTNLDVAEKAVMRAKIGAKFRVATNIPLPTPANPEDHVRVEGFWIERGACLPRGDENYVVTTTVKASLAEIARIVCSGRFPVLLEGETSAGKTSIVCHLAKVTGNQIVRINNHEHTDVQEYMGSYVADSAGRLVFREGALVRAVRDGSWVILDELNLAPTDVIEALNRLLDDNRELFVPEINETIRAHRKFRLFATQNPAGTYSGRKKLSRALLSRFVVLRFHHLPMNELAEMVCKRCEVANSAATKMIDVLSELRNKRSLGGLFSARDGLMTLRDVFRWARRLATDETCDDWLQVLINHGFFLLAGRCRNAKDELTVVETLQKVIKRKIDKDALFALDSPYLPTDVTTTSVVMTSGMRRMLVLTQQAWLRGEAVLLVGETGGGKTSLAELVGRGRLRSINCHERTETADLLGRLRPKHDGGFEWTDGVVISSMRDGVPLLIDEISLAEDSVLERLNPLFEEEKTLLLTDAGVETQVVHSTAGFQLIATMNPGGDYGKKELSKALRNRFTEVWTTSDYANDELLAIFDARLARTEATRDESRVSPTQAARAVVEWISQFFAKYSHVFRHAPSVRDVVACAELYASAVAANVQRRLAVLDALSAVFLDALSGLTTRVSVDTNDVLRDALHMMASIMKHVELVDDADGFLEAAATAAAKATICLTADGLRVGHLRIPVGPAAPKSPKAFSLHAPTCVENVYRIARGLLINKPILLEGAPGCGKSSTVMALAQLTGNPITRLNLSDQTDLSDLFGSDVPVLTDEGTITFRWEDGPVLRAIKNGEWVLLDEMNLASQSVLEGLNACFDHRRVLYIAELNKSFEIPATSNCRFFACQNPRGQGGNRRALPKSFVNRFTNIYTNDLTAADVEKILEGVDVDGRIPAAQRSRMVVVNQQCSESADRGCFVGGPHSFNLRDLLRWFELTVKTGDIGASFELVYVNRMRRDEDKQQVRTMFERNLERKSAHPSLQLTVGDDFVRIGKTSIQRRKGMEVDEWKRDGRLLPSQMSLLHTLAVGVEMNWLALIVGPRNSGKRSVVENLATICGRRLRKIALNADTDAQELIGSYEQVIDDEVVEKSKAKIVEMLERTKLDGVHLMKIKEAVELLQLETAVELALSQLDDESILSACRDVLQEAACTVMRFEWADSVFVDAYLGGHWIFIDDVNLCSAAVLDRLNSCLESGGNLVVSERQTSYEPLRPHPDFRVFLSMDCKTGEVSRAMRNRSVETFVDENMRWYTSVEDVETVVGPSSGFSPTTAKHVSELGVEKQLHLAVSLQQLPVEEACRYAGVAEAMEDDGDVVWEKLATPPSLEDLLSSTGAYEEWLLVQWRRAASAAAGSATSPEVALLPILSTSSAILASGLLVKSFGARMEKMASRLTSMLRKQKTQIKDARTPFDATFSGGMETWNDRSLAQRGMAVACLEWARQVSTAIELERSSAEHLSSTMSKYEMATSELGFKNLPLVATAVDAIFKAMSTDGDVHGTPSDVFSALLSLMLFVAAARRRMTLRSGCAPLYLAWNDVQNASGVTFGRQLTNIKVSLDDGWSSAAFDEFAKNYVVRWRTHPIVKPFDNREQCERYVNGLEETMRAVQDLAVGDSPMVAVNNDDEDDEDAMPTIPTSPIVAALRLIGSIQSLHAFFAAGTADKSDRVLLRLRVFDGLAWSDANRARWLHIVATMSATLDDVIGDDDTRLDVGSLGDASSHAVATTSFVGAIGFDPTMSSLVVAHLRDFGMRALRTRLWRLASNSQLIRTQIQQNLSQLEMGLPGWCDELDASKSQNENDDVVVSGCLRRIRCGLGIMQKALPPAETLDPVVFEEERVLFVKAKRGIVEKQLKMLEEWRKLVARQEKGCDENSQNSVVRRLHELGEELVALDDDESGDSHQGEEVESVHRQSASQYWTLCAEMRSFKGLTSTVADDVQQNVANREGDATKASIRVAQINSFVMSSSSFREKLLHDFASFVDVAMPFVGGLTLVESAMRQLAARLAAGQRRAKLVAATAFPRILTMTPSTNGPTSREAMSWAVRDASPMPLRLKASLMRQRLLRRDATTFGEPQFDLQWVRNQWKKWYERNVAKAAEKDFVYRTKTEEEKDELDVIEFFSQDAQEREVLPANDVSLLLEAFEVGDNANSRSSLVDEAEKATSDARFKMALVWIRHVVNSVGLMPSDDVISALNADSDQNVLELISGREGFCDANDEKATVEIVDVYRCSSLRECRRAAGLLESLAQTTKEVQQRWPEVVALKNVLRAIDEFNATSVSTTHIKLAALIEKLIEECEQWEKMADRANSLRDPLRALQQLLVDWKKMEVRCWASLLARAESDARQRAQLVALPLFDALFEGPSDGNSLVPMAVEWMHNASLVDFATRVRSVDALADWARTLGRDALANRLRSAASHFAQFVTVVNERLDGYRQPAAQALQDYLKIVKYNDLNLWSIKVSSQKAHTHLFKIIRRFNESASVQVDAEFDKLIPMSEWKLIGGEHFEALQRVRDSNDDDDDEEEKLRRIRRASQLAAKVARRADELCATSIGRLDELAEQTRDADDSLRTMINYVGEDAEKEKQQGYARNSRQRQVAMVLKEAQAVGLNARRAVAVKSETLSDRSVSGVSAGRCDVFVRLCAAGRNTTIRKANKVDQQVGVSTRKHLTGMIEYGMVWQLDLHDKIAEWNDDLAKIGQAVEYLTIAARNSQENWHVDNEAIEGDVERIAERVQLISVFVDAMQRRVAAIPDDVDDIDASCCEHLHPLSRLHLGDDRAKHARQRVAGLSGVVGNLRVCNESIMSKRTIFARSDVVSWKERLMSETSELRAANDDLRGYFAVETREIAAHADFVEQIAQQVYDVQPEEQTLNTTSLLMLVQTLYKEVVEAHDSKNEKDEEKALDTIIRLRGCMEKCQMANVAKWLADVVDEMRRKPNSTTNLASQLAQLVDVVHRLLEKCSRLLADALAQFCALYRAVLSLTVQLFEKGYVNTIPKAEKQESGDGATDEAGEGGGMGDGSTADNAKDVTDEMEETGQLEGLQDDPPPDPEDQHADDTNEKPVEMDEDFAEDLQDIDRNEKGGPDDEEGDDEEEPEPEPEDQMGEVDEEDEKQLDPKLWDEEDEEPEPQQKNMDQENTAADRKTDEMVAQEEEPQAEEDGKEKEQPELADEQENVDERERDDDEDEKNQGQVDDDARMEDEIGPDDDEAKGDDAKEDVADGEDGDETDPEDDDALDGDGEDDEKENEDVEMNDQPNESDDRNEKEQDEKMEQGTGGEQKDDQKKDQEAGGAAEDKDDEDDDDETKEDEDKGEGKNKNDPRGESGAGEKAKEKDDDAREDVDDEKADQKKEAKELAEAGDEDDVENEAEQGEGEENESGELVENAAAAQRRMLGAGSLDEAKQTKREQHDDATKEKPKKRQLPQGVVDEAGVEGGDVEDDDAKETKQASIHLAATDMFDLAEEVTKELVLGTVDDDEEMHQEGHEGHDEEENTQAESQWAQMSRTVAILSAELAENLRLILEPQRASKMQGDYRSGKRLNMRRLIPYIASEYRKDRIWMRRTKRAQREYQILIAVDDSASMNENGIHQVTCESVCVVEDALRRCDAGSVSVCSFGSDVRTIIPFGETSATSSVEMLRKLTFGQKSTDLLLLLSTARRQLDEIRTPTSEQMLIIISDGRGALYQGAEKVKASYAALQGVTVLFVILDSGDKSIHEVKVASFTDDGVVLTPYLSMFPFPFYAVVNAVEQLPSIVAESIRQWFEMTSQNA